MRQYPAWRLSFFNLRIVSYQEENAGTLVDRFVKIGPPADSRVFYQIDRLRYRRRLDGVRMPIGDVRPDGKEVLTAEDSPAGGARAHCEWSAEATYIDVHFNSRNQGMRPQLELLRAAEPDAVISVGTYSACAALVREARDADWDVLIAHSLRASTSENMLSAAARPCRPQQSGEKTTPKNLDQLRGERSCPTYNDNEAAPAVVEYRELMDRYHPQPPAELLNEPYEAPTYSFISFEGMLNAKLLVKMLDKLGPDPKRKRRSKRSPNRSIPATWESTCRRLSPPERHQGLRRVYCATVSGRSVCAAFGRRLAEVQAMKSSRLFTKMLIWLVLLFGITTVATAVFSAHRLSTHLHREFESKGEAIANSIASASVSEMIL